MAYTDSEFSTDACGSERYDGLEIPLAPWLGYIIRLLGMEMDTPKLRAR